MRHKVNGKLTNREHKDVQRLARDRSLFSARVGAQYYVRGRVTFFPGSSDVPKLFSAQFFPLSEIKNAQFSNMSISQVIQKAEFAYVDLRFTLHVT